MYIIVARLLFENSMSWKQAISASDILCITNKAEAETASALYTIGLNCT
ncbi:hypothetical protein QSI_0882 [Clostridioides difficile P28]|nr:hypothetical protein QSI_0882 [Clostridioides difficile P28]